MAARKKKQLPHKDERGKWATGNKARVGTAGKVAGRTLALRELDTMLSNSVNLRHLRLKLQESMRHDPLWFFRNIVMPLIPKEQLLEVRAGESEMGAAILEALRERMQGD